MMNMYFVYSVSLKLVIVYCIKLTLIKSYFFMNQLVKKELWFSLVACHLIILWIQIWRKLHYNNYSLVYNYTLNKYLSLDN